MHASALRTPSATAAARGASPAEEGEPKMRAPRASANSHVPASTSACSGCRGKQPGASDSTAADAAGGMPVLARGLRAAGDGGSERVARVCRAHSCADSCSSCCRRSADSCSRSRRHCRSTASGCPPSLVPSPTSNAAFEKTVVSRPSSDADVRCRGTNAARLEPSQGRARACTPMYALFQRQFTCRGRRGGRWRHICRRTPGCLSAGISAALFWQRIGLFWKGLQGS
eukprot:364751-Chlamydomonas_euryale.AAC.3